MANKFLVNHIYHDDARTFLLSLPNESVDLVFTDPPYPKKYLECFQILADECPRIMKHGASLVTLLGHYELEIVMEMFMDRLKFRWILEMEQHEGSHSRMAMGIEVMWKPALWYVKGFYPNGKGFLRDGISVTQSKESHEWEQDKIWSDYYVPRLCEPNGLMIDPFCGSGTFLLSAKESGINYLGCDVDENSVNMSLERLNG